MAKITALEIADQLTGDEHLPIVQGADTKRVTMSAFRALITPFLQYWYKGEAGPSGPASSSYPTVVLMKAAPVSNRTYTLASPTGSDAGFENGPFEFRAGDYTQRPDVVPIDGVPLSAGALVRQRARALGFAQSDGAVRSLEDKARETVSVLDYWYATDIDFTNAFNRAIATGKKVFVPYRAEGYIVEDIAVVSNMHIFGEKNGMSLAPCLIVRRSNKSAFYNTFTAGITVHCTFENLACKAAPDAIGTCFYSQSTQILYSAYFTFRNIETYKNLKISYSGLWIFAVWDRCRDGYLGGSADTEHSGIVGLAGAYGQDFQQNINRVSDSMFFNSFGGDATVVLSYGVLFTFENTNFEGLQSRAFSGYNMFNVAFRNCWFENISAPAIFRFYNYNNEIPAASTGLVEHCNFVLTGTAPLIAEVQNPSSVSFKSNFFGLIGAGVKLCNDGARVTANDDNFIASGPGASSFMDNMHRKTVENGRTLCNGANDHGLADGTFQNAGSVTASGGFLSMSKFVVGNEFVSIAKSTTGLGGVVTITGINDARDGSVSLIKRWHFATIDDVAPPINASGKVLSFQVLGDDLQMKVDTGTLTINTTLTH